MKPFNTHFNMLTLYLACILNVKGQVPNIPILWLDAAVGISQNAVNQVSEWKGKNNHNKVIQDIVANHATYIPASIGNLPAFRFICIQIKPILI
jgi:hypothetical protein